VQVFLVREALFERIARQVASRLELREHGRLFHLQANVERDGEQHEAQKERNAPAELAECVLAVIDARRADDAHAQEKADRGRRLDVARVIAALVVRHVLRDVDHGAAVLAAERKPLQKPE